MATQIALVNANGPLGRRVLARTRIMRWTAVWMTPSTVARPVVLILKDA